MTLLPVADGARLLGIHPKTLHHWLKKANIPPALHPTDARIKCVSEEHLHQVACLHGRSLQVPAPVDPASPPLIPPEARHPHVAKQEMASASIPCSFLTCCGSEADLIHKLSDLETKVATLQEHIAQLSLALLKAQEQSIEHRLATLEALLQSLVEKPFSAPPTLEVVQEPLCPPRKPRPLHPVEQLARSRMPPLVEYCAPGRYAIISAQDGEVQVQPDSRAWFDWLATLSSFRWTCWPLYRAPRIQGWPANALLVGFALCPPSYLQALSGHDREFDHCQPGTGRCRTSSGHRCALSSCACPCPWLPLPFNKCGCSASAAFLKSCNKRRDAGGDGPQEIVPRPRAWRAC
ncbi:MAG TPA: hypothetical protein VFV38_26430 [Ktedonobacteraceae bacterium]|nr:hypothetical protein [Ktedonobacteraceae bacterium]